MSFLIKLFLRDQILSEITRSENNNPVAQNNASKMDEIVTDVFNRCWGMGFLSDQVKKAIKGVYKDHLTEIKSGLMGQVLQRMKLAYTRCVENGLMKFAAKNKIVKELELYFPQYLPCELNYIYDHRQNIQNSVNGLLKPQSNLFKEDSVSQRKKSEIFAEVHKLAKRSYHR